LTYPVERSLV